MGDTFERRRTKQQDIHRETVVLEPGMSLKDYGKLQRKWKAKLSATGFTDIEYVSETGQVSPFFRGYSSQALANRMDESVLDYYCMARTFLHRADWKAIAPERQSKLYEFMWNLHSDGFEFAEIVTALKKRVERSFGNKRKPSYGMSIWFVHTAIKRIESVMLELVRHNPEFFE